MGSDFVRHLYNKYPKYNLFVLDLLTYAGSLDNLESIVVLEKKKSNGSKRFFFIKGDICDQKFVSELFKKYKFDVVVNYAAESHVDRSIRWDYHFLRSNFLGVHNLIWLVKKHQIPRFIQISTDEIFGDVLEGFSKEHSPIRPSNPYSASKAAADILLQSYIRTHKLPIILVRGSNNFGPYQYPDKLIPLTITNLLEEGQKIPIHGNGIQKRMWVHVNDFSSAVDLAMHKAEDFSIYNISGIEMSNLEIVEKICHVLEKDHKKCIMFVSDRPGGDYRYSLDSSKIKKELGWEIQYPIHKSLESVVSWYVKNVQWWKRAKKTKDFKIFYGKQYKSEY